jgi:DNA-binding beta-propeller fold protein YncE
MTKHRKKFVLGALGLFLFAAIPSANAAEALQFTVDPAWPKTLPNKWILGEIGGMATDAQNNVWVLQRPRSLTEDEKGAALNPPRSQCCMPAPSVIQFDSAGNVKSAWGGPGQGYQWPEREHALRLDNKGNVYLSGNGPKDQMLVKFTTDGKFVKQFGRLVDPLGSKDTTAVGRPADIFYDQAGNELYIADGYGNHRVLVIDAETFAFKRMWGAYGKAPEDPMPRVEPAPGTSTNFATANAYNPEMQHFGNPVHCVKIANDGLVYVCDRTNNRIQVFQKNGTFVKQLVIRPETRGTGSSYDLAFWPDRNQTYMIIADGADNEAVIVRRDDGKEVGFFGHYGRQAGQFHNIHQVVVDSKGNVYTGEVDTGMRIQKFVPNAPPAR